MLYIMTTVYFTKYETLVYLVKIWNQTKNGLEKNKIKQRINILTGKQQPKFDINHIMNDIFIYKFDVETMLYNYYIIEDSLYKNFIDDNYSVFNDKMQLLDHNKFFDIRFIWDVVADLIKLRNGYQNKPKNIDDTEYIMNNVKELNGHKYKKLFNIINRKQEPIINEFLINFNFVKGLN